jgi:hypothetical protein
MNKLAAIAGTLLLAAVPAVAQDSTHSEALGTIDRFFAALNRKDVEGLKAVTTEKGYIRVASYAEGRPPYRERSFEEDRVQIGKTEETLREVYWDPTVLVHRDIAVAWMPYSFDYDGKRSHCGVDVFDLVRIAGEWKIASVMYTVEPEGCPKGR